MITDKYIKIMWICIIINILTLGYWIPKALAFERLENGHPEKCLVSQENPEVLRKTEKPFFPGKSFAQGNAYKNMTIKGGSKSFTIEYEGLSIGWRHFGESPEWKEELAQGYSIVWFTNGFAKWGGEELIQETIPYKMDKITVQNVSPGIYNVVTGPETRNCQTTDEWFRNIIVTE